MDQHHPVSDSVAQGIVIHFPFTKLNIHYSCIMSLATSPLHNIDAACYASNNQSIEQPKQTAQLGSPKF